MNEKLRILGNRLIKACSNNYKNDEKCDLLKELEKISRMTSVSKCNEEKRSMKDMLIQEKKYLEHHAAETLVGLGNIGAAAFTQYQIQENIYSTIATSLWFLVGVGVTIYNGKKCCDSMRIVRGTNTILHATNVKKSKIKRETIDEKKYNNDFSFKSIDRYFDKDFSNDNPEPIGYGRKSPYAKRR